MAELDPESGIQEPQLTRDDILVLTVEELKYECLRRNLDTPEYCIIEIHYKKH